MQASHSAFRKKLFEWIKSRMKMTKISKKSINKVLFVDIFVIFFFFIEEAVKAVRSIMRLMVPLKMSVLEYFVCLVVQIVNVNRSHSWNLCQKNQCLWGVSIGVKNSIINIATSSIPFYKTLNYFRLQKERKNIS